MRKILLGLLTAGAVGGVTMLATNAFFSDTETSTDNRFQAGDIDLKIDNTSYVIDYLVDQLNPVGAIVASNATTWTVRDLTVEKFFNFTDVKPGDIGEDTISVHVGSNNAWVCASVNITNDTDQSCTEPELADDPTCVAPNTNGELDSAVNFVFWVDDGDNVYEPVAGQSGVAETLFLSSPLSSLGNITLADSGSSVLGGHNPIPGGTTFNIGKAWCFGTLTPTNLVQNGTNTGNPTNLGTGFTCNGSLVNNAAQTDQVIGDLRFYAVQSRNNPGFLCSQLPPFTL